MTATISGMELRATMIVSTGTYCAAGQGSGRCGRGYMYTALLAEVGLACISTAPRDRVHRHVLRRAETGVRVQGTLGEGSPKSSQSPQALVGMHP